MYDAKDKSLEEIKPVDKVTNAKLKRNKLYIEGVRNVRIIFWNENKSI